MKKSIVLLPMVIVLFGFRLHAQEDNAEHFLSATWFISASAGSPAIGPAWSIGGSMSDMGYNQTQTSHFLYTSVTEHPHSRFFWFEKVPWNVSIRYRFAENYLLSASLENTMAMTTEGFNGKQNINVASSLRSYSMSVSMIFGENPSYLWFGIGPSLHQIILAPNHFLLDIPETKEKIGVTVQAGIVAMISDRLFMEMGSHFRYVGSVSIGPSILSLSPVSQQLSIDANFNHIFFSVGLGASIF